MNITKHGNLIQLTRLVGFNSYLLLEDDGCTVIDTNLPGSAQGIYDAAKQFNSPIRRIVLTHAHNDHVASADALHALVPDTEVIVSERSAAFLRGEMDLLPGEPTDALRGGYTVIETKPTRLVNEGDIIGSLQVIAAPGHTPGQIALLDTRDQSLIAGDAFATQFGAVVSGKMNWLFPFPAMATWHKPTALATAKKLYALEPTLLAIGHGKMIKQPASVMQQAINEAEKTFS